MLVTSLINVNLNMFIIELYIFLYLIHFIFFTWDLTSNRHDEHSFLFCDDIFPIFVL